MTTSILLFLFITGTASAQWTIIDSISGANFITTHFFSADTGIIGGQMGGKFVRTTNGGQSWDTAYSPTNTQFFDMQFVSSSVGFACGGSHFSADNNVLARTNDGGITWTNVAYNLHPADMFEYIGLSFRNADTGIVYGNYTLYRATNGGTALDELVKPISNFVLEHAALLHDNSIVVSGFYSAGGTFLNQLYRSTNWGSSWTLLFSDTTLRISSIAFKGSHGIATLNKGVLLSTTDNGQTWHRHQHADDSTNFFRISFGTGGNIFLSAFKNGNGYIYTSTDNGISLHTPYINIGAVIWDICMPHTDTGYFITNREIYKTINGGGALNSNQHLPLEHRVIVYPNPAHKVIYADAGTATITTIQLYDMQGRKTAALEKGNSLDISGLAEGIYLLYLQVNGETIVRKVQIQR